MSRDANMSKWLATGRFNEKDDNYFGIAKKRIAEAENNPVQLELL